MNFRSIALGGVTWSMASQVLRMCLQIGTTIILARLLSPDDFGLYAMALPVIALANLLQDIGLNQSMIQSRDLKLEQADKLFWINMAGSVAIALVMIATAPLVAGFYQEPRLTDILNAWAVVLVVGAFGFGQYAMLARHFRFRLLALIDMSCASVAFLVVLGYSWVWPSYWALWFTGLASVVVWVVMTWLLSGWRPGWPRRHVSLHGMFTFGLSVAGHNIANYVVRNLDNILIGRAFGAVTLGFYDRAYKLLLYPLENLGNPIGRVVVPILSRMQDDAEAFRRAYLQASGLLSLLIMPGMAVAVACSNEVVRILLGDAWSSVSAIFFWLGLAGLVQPLLISTNWLFLAKGRGAALLQVSVVSSLLISAGFLVGIRWGAVGVAASYAIAEIFLRAPLQIYQAGKFGGVSHRDILMEYAPQVAACMLAFGAVLLMREFGLIGWRLILSSLIVAYGFAICCMVSMPSGRYVLMAGWRIVSDMRGGLSKRPAP